MRSYGAIRGQAKADPDAASFVLREQTYGGLVSCYLDGPLTELPRELWGKNVIVEGWLLRDDETGRPIAINRITNVQPCRDVEPGSYRLARGVLPRSPGDELPEVVIRRLRDQ